LSESQFWIKWLICVLLKNIWSSGRHSFHPQLHYIHQNAQWLPWVIWNQRLSLFNDCGLRDAFFRMTLSRILEPSLDCSKAVYKALEQSKNSHNIINDLQRIKLFRIIIECEDLRWSWLFDYTPHLVSISRPFWKYESGFLGRQQQSLAEAQYSGKFKLKFVRILVTHPIYIYIYIKYGLRGVYV